MRRMPLLVTAALGALLAACSRGDKGPALEAVATVNGSPITTEAFARELAFAQRTSAGVVPEAGPELLAFRRAVLDELIDRTLVLAAAQEAGLSVPSEKVDRELLRLKAEYHGSGYADALAEGQLSQQELRERTRARLLVELYFVERVFSRHVVTDREIEDYYQKHPDEFVEPEQVRASQIVVNGPEEAKKVQALLRSGTAFEDAARRFSLSPDGKVGGDLGFFKRGVMPAVFDSTCFDLPVGRVSEVVPSEYGFHLFKVVDKRPQRTRTLSEARADVEKKLLRAKHEQAQKDAIESMRKRAPIHVDEAVLAKVP